jgi:glutamate dehydrogenase (NAD(P)+)
MIYSNIQNLKGSAQGFDGAVEMELTRFDYSVISFNSSSWNQITGLKCMYQVKAEVVAEGANGPIDTEGEAIYKTWITIIPDIIKNLEV